MFSMTNFGRERSETVDSMSSQSSKGFRIKRKFTNICQEAVKSIYFWILVAVCTFAEPMMCAYYPSTFLHYLQFAVLGLSTILFFMQLVGVAANEWAKISAIEALASFKGLSIRRKASTLTWLKLWIFFTAEGEYFFEGIILIYAWVTLPYRPGLAILRCFRVFRLLWFYEVEVFRGFLHLTMGRIIGERFIHRAINVLKFSINAIKALAGEVFSLTEETRGGLMLIMIFFYSAFVLGATMWVEGEGHFINCHGVGECTFTLIRLTFLDGDGFDFAYNLTNGHYILFFITMGYLVITALGILNGLVGIFGSLITTASIQAFDENQEEAALMYDANSNGDGNGEGQGLLSDGGEVYNTNLGPSGDESDDSEEEDGGAYSGNANAIMDDPNAYGPDGTGPNVSGSSSVDDGEGTTGKTSKVTGGALRRSMDMMQERDVSVIDLEAQASGIFPASPVPASTTNSSPVKSIISRGLSGKAKNMQKYVRMQADDDDDDDDDDGDVKNFEADANDDLFSIDSTTMQPRVRRNSNAHVHQLPGPLEKIQSGAALLARNNSAFMQGRLPAHNKSSAGMSMHNILHATGGGSKFVMQQLAKRQREQSMRNLHANTNASSSQAQLAAAGHLHGNSHGLTNSLPSFFAPKINPTLAQPSANIQQRPSLTSVNGNPEAAVLSPTGSSKEPHVTEQMSPPPSELASPVTEEVRKKSVRNRFQMAAHMAKATAAATATATVNTSAPTAAASAAPASAAPHPVNPHHAHLIAAINSGGTSTPVGMFPGAAPAPKKINNMFGALGGHHHGASHVSNASAHSNTSNSLFEVALRQHQQQQQQQQHVHQQQQQILQQQHGSVSVASALPPALAHFMSDQSQLGEKHTRQLDALQQQMQQMQQTIVSQQDMLQKLMQSLTHVTSLLVQQQQVQQQVQQQQQVIHHSGSAHHHHNSSSSSSHHGHSHEAATQAAPSAVAVAVNVHANVPVSSAPNTAESEISAITTSPSPDDAVHPLKTSHKSAKFKVSGATGNTPSVSTGAPTSSAANTTANGTTGSSNRAQGMQLMDMFRPRSAAHHHGSGHHGAAASTSSTAASTGSNAATTSGKGATVLAGGVSPTVPGLSGPPLQAIFGIDGAGRSGQPTRNRYGGSAAANGTGNVLDGLQPTRNRYGGSATANGTGNVLDGLQSARSGRDGGHNKATHHGNDAEDLSTLYHQAQHQREVGLGLAPARSFGGAAEKSAQPAGPSTAAHPMSATGRVVSAAAVTALTDDSSKQSVRTQLKNGPSDGAMTADEYELVDVDVLSSKRK